MSKKKQRRIGVNGTRLSGAPANPLGGNSRAHSIAKKRREGWTARKIAKDLGVSLAEVRGVLAKVGL